MTTRQGPVAGGLPAAPESHDLLIGTLMTTDEQRRQARTLRDLHSGPGRYADGGRNDDEDQCGRELQSPR